MLREAAWRRHMDRRAVLQRRHASAQTQAALFVIGLFCFCSALLTGLYVAYMASSRAELEHAAGSAPPDAAYAAALRGQLPPSSDTAWQEHSELEKLYQGLLGKQKPPQAQLDLAVAKHAQPPQQQSTGSSRMQRMGEHDDFVVVLSVTGSMHARLDDLHLQWQGLRVFVASNESQPLGPGAFSPEGWAVLEDDEPLRAPGQPEASRAALAPFLALRQLGPSFKWAFAATRDAETLFFPRSASAMVADLDPDMPYLLTDNLAFNDRLWEGTRSPHPAAPACVPCGWAGNASELGFPMPPGCPCRPAALCAADASGSLFPNASEHCGIPRLPRPYSLEGRAGALLSVGLLRSVPLADMQDCTYRQWASGMWLDRGDAMLTACVWETAGIAPTAPDPLWHPDALSAFDASSPLLPDPFDGSRRAGWGVPVKVSRALGNLLSAAAGACNALCQLELQHVASLHLAAGIFEERPAAALAVAQLFGALQAHLTAASTGLGMAQAPADVQTAVLQHLMSVQPSGNASTAVRVVKEGPLAAALRALHLMSATGPATVEAAHVPSHTLLAAPALPRGFRGTSQRPAFSLAERAEVGAAEGIAWQLLQHLLAAAEDSSSPHMQPPLAASRIAKRQSLTAGARRLAPDPVRLLALEKRRQQASEPTYPSSAEDFVVAIPTHDHRVHMLPCSRPSRQGVRAFFATNSSTHGTADAAAHNESWGFYPDAQPLRSFYAGDARAAIVPFLAYQHYGGSFKWLFYGDDDSVLFLRGAMNIVAGLDPDMPYALTDNMWFSYPTSDQAYHPCVAAPACVPCGYPQERLNRLPFAMARGCPCTPEAICAADGTGALNKPPKPCGMPRIPGRTYSAHGGAGVLMSVGLFRRVRFEQMHACVQGGYNSGGDAMWTECLWKAGVGLTSPDPLWHPHGLTMFDPSPPGPQPDDDILPKAAHSLGNLLSAAAGTCRGLCQLELDHTAVLHLRSRRFSSDEAVYNTIHAFSLLLCALREQQDRPASSSGGGAANKFRVPAHCAGEGGLGRGEQDLQRSGALSRHIETAVAVLQRSTVSYLGGAEGEALIVHEHLERASAGAARVAARKLLDTVVRKARALVVEVEA